jgi:hypothetical protein
MSTVTRATFIERIRALIRGWGRWWVVRHTYHEYKSTTANLTEAEWAKIEAEMDRACQAMDEIVVTFNEAMKRQGRK